MSIREVEESHNLLADYDANVISSSGRDLQDKPLSLWRIFGFGALWLAWIMFAVVN
jgi:hypothetical protein